LAAVQLMEDLQLTRKVIKEASLELKGDDEQITA
jgi:hypothetical protein